MKISALAALVAVLSTFAGSAAQAGGASGAGGDIRSGPNAASNSQSQGHGGDVHTDSGKSGASGGDVLADARVSEAIWTPGDLGRAVLLAGNGLRLFSENRRGSMTSVLKKGRKIRRPAEVSQVSSR